MEGGTQGNQPRHGLNAPRPFRMPPQRAAHRRSYRIADVLLAIVVAAGVLSLLWGYGAAYQIGYSAAADYFGEVSHG